MAEGDLVEAVLNGLPKDYVYDTMIAIISAGDQELRIRDVMAKLHQAEQRFESLNVHPALRDTMERVNAAREATYEKGGQHHEDRTCYYCHNPGTSPPTATRNCRTRITSRPTFALSMRYE